MSCERRCAMRDVASTFTRLCRHCGWSVIRGRSGRSSAIQNEAVRVVFPGIVLNAEHGALKLASRSEEDTLQRSIWCLVRNSRATEEKGTGEIGVVATEDAQGA